MPGEQGLDFGSQASDQTFSDGRRDCSLPLVVGVADPHARGPFGIAEESLRIFVKGELDVLHGGDPIFLPLFPWSRFPVSVAP